MGVFNRLHFEDDCPHCGFAGRVMAELKMGRLNFDDYEVGDELLWRGPGERLRRQERPTTGYLADYAYAVCPKCDEAWWAWVTVEGNQIRKVEASAGPDPFGSDS